MSRMYTSLKKENEHALACQMFFFSEENGEHPPLPLRHDAGSLNRNVIVPISTTQYKLRYMSNVIPS